jgi:hypothetical protein
VLLSLEPLLCSSWFDGSVAASQIYLYQILRHMLAGTGQNYKLIAEIIPKGQKMYEYIFFVF